MYRQAPAWRIEMNETQLVNLFPERIEWAYPAIDHGSWEGTFREDSVMNRHSILWSSKLFGDMKPYIETFFQQLEQKVYAWNNERWSVQMLDEDDNPAYWTYFCMIENWSSEFFDAMLQKQRKENIATINWQNVSRYAKHIWKRDFIENYHSEIADHLHVLCENQHFPWKEHYEMFVEQFTNEDFHKITTNTSLPMSLESIKQYEHKWKWGYNGLERRKDLQEQIMSYYKDKFDWNELSVNTSLPITLLQKYRDHVAWEVVSKRKDLKLADMDLSLPWNWSQVFRHNHDILIEDFLAASVVEAFLREL
ncbi:MAG: hypothetical protein EBR30_05025 [Cytophagia bacterium]|nr:hypothetical protein [Cytophagia bacterium]